MKAVRTLAHTHGVVPSCPQASKQVRGTGPISTIIMNHPASGHLITTTVNDRCANCTVPVYR